MKVITNGFRFRVGVSLVFGLFWTGAAVGDGPLFPGAQYAVGDEPRSAAIGDLNGDQAPDLAVANGDSDNVSVLLGLGDGTFAVAVHYAAGDGPLSLAIGDLDGDQAPDLIVANYYGDNVSVLPGLGDGTFTAAVNYPVGDGCYSVAIGDLDGDLAPDLAVANILSDDVSVLLHQFPDCNGNDILDACDIDCGPAGGPCDLPGCGQSGDCNSNGVPDECDILSGESDDKDVNGIPDDCEQDIPTVSEWGLIVMTLLVLTTGTLICMRRRAAQVRQDRG